MPDCALRFSGNPYCYRPTLIGHLTTGSTKLGSKSGHQLGFEQCYRSGDNPTPVSLVSTRRANLGRNFLFDAADKSKTPHARGHIVQHVVWSMLRSEAFKRQIPRRDCPRQEKLSARSLSVLQVSFIRDSRQTESTLTVPHCPMDVRASLPIRAGQLR